jgi:putative polyhydroxyalkanoate system protein
MAIIKVAKAHTLGQEEALKRAQELVRDLGQKLKADVKWDGPRATLKGTGFSGKADVSADKVAVDVDLSFMLSPMKGKIESKIEQALQEKFA